MEYRGKNTVHSYWHYCVLLFYYNTVYVVNVCIFTGNSHICGIYSKHFSSELSNKYVINNYIFCNVNNIKHILPVLLIWYTVTTVRNLKSKAKNKKISIYLQYVLFTCICTIKFYVVYKRITKFMRWFCMKYLNIFRPFGIFAVRFIELNCMVYST